MLKPFLMAMLIGFCSPVFAQETQEEVFETIDALRVQWDTEAVNLETYEGLESYCRNRAYRDNTILLLNQIHHYDSSLYKIVTMKYAVDQDPEARATIDDIETLEVDYTTKSFMIFLREECMTFNDVERNKNMEGYEAYRKELEAELIKYVTSITKQIDIIDEHAHHLTIKP